jgi:hypothetical protein
MKSTNTIIKVLLFLLILSCNSKGGIYGNAIVSSNHNVYEEDNIYFPHDYFIGKSLDGLLDNVLTLNKIDDFIIITNKYNDGFSGHKISFQVKENLHIENVEYDQWDDIEDGSETKYFVEKVILFLNDNPFTNTLITGHYTLQIKEEYTAGDLLENEGFIDTTAFRIFHGKFKVYSEQEKQNGKEWVISQNEISLGIKENADVYLMPDQFPEYKWGDDSLNQILSRYEIDRSKTEVENRKFITLIMMVDENGKVDPDSMEIGEKMKSNELLEALKRDSKITSNWQPAIHKGRNVKSEVYLPIKIKE